MSPKEQLEAALIRAKQKQPAAVRSAPGDPLIPRLEADRLEHDLKQDNKQTGFTAAGV